MTPPTAPPLPPPPTDRPDALYEFVDGRWQETPRMGALGSLLASQLGHRLGELTRLGRGGMVLSETLFRLAPEGPARRPDLALVKADRWREVTALWDDPPAIDVVPNLAVEVPGPTCTCTELLDKVRDYFAAGVEMVWGVFPRHRLVYVYTAPDQVHILTDRQVLDGGTMLPGFKLTLAEFFNASGKP